MREKKTIRNISAADGTLTYLFAILANLGVQIFAAGIVVFSRSDTLAETALFNFSMMLLIQAAFFAVFYFTVVKKGYTLDIGIKNRPHISAFVLAPVLALLSILAFYAPTAGFSFILDKIGYEVPSLSDMSTPLEYILGLGVILIAAPVMEELIFRGVLLSALKEKAGAKNAVIMSALAFMLMHMSPAQTVYQFLFGLVLGAAAVITGSVLIPALIHSFSNLIAFLLDYTAVGTLAESFIVLISKNIFLILAVGILFFAAFTSAIYFILKFLRSKHAEEKTLKTEMKVLAVKPVFDESGGAIYFKADTGKDKDIMYKRLYFVAVGICAFMWITAIVSSLLAS